MIGYYVHHQGHGHLHRALCLAEHLDTPVTILTSLPRPARLPTAIADWIMLDRDDDPPITGDPTARGTLHWAPPRHPGLRRRTATIAAWIGASAPTLLVVDVSVEIIMLSRLMGIPVVAVAMPGDRHDRAHRIGYDAADALLACWPATFTPTDWPATWTGKTSFVGSFSRFDHRHRPGPAEQAERRAVTLLLGSGGSEVRQRHIAAATAVTPGWDWDVLGGPSGPWRADPWPSLCTADVVVTHAGQNAVAEVAAARAPAIVIPQLRPHAEQHATAAALATVGAALVLERWPDTADWPNLLDSAAALDGHRWAVWSAGDGAARAAGLIDSLAEDAGGRA